MSKYVLTLLLLLPAFTYADVEVNVGFFTEHLSGDKPEYNEDNELVQLSYVTDIGVEYSVATFSNSHYVRSHLVGIGKRWGDVSLGLTLVHGYEGHITSHVGNLIFMPVLALDLNVLKVNLIGNVVNVGMLFKF